MCNRLLIYNLSSELKYPSVSISEIARYVIVGSIAKLNFRKIDRAGEGAFIWSMITNIRMRVVAFCLKNRNQVKIINLIICQDRKQN